MNTQAFAILGAESRRRDRPSWNSVITQQGLSCASELIAASIGIMVAVLVIAPFSMPAGHFGQTGEFKLWFFVICAQTAFWAALVRPLLAWVIADLRDVWPGHRGEILAMTVPCAVLLEGFLVFVTAHSGIHYPLPHHTAKMMVLSELGSAVALIGVLCIALTDAKLAELKNLSAVGIEDLESYAELRDKLRLLVTIEGAIIGVAVLSSGALRNALLASHPHSSEFPSEYVLVYGAFFSLLLALFTLPVYQRLHAVGRGLRDAAFPLEAPEHASWSDWYEDRKRFEELLQLPKATSGGRFAGIVVLTPLVISFLTLLLRSA